MTPITEIRKHLKAARQLLSDRRNWTSGAMARDAFGVYVRCKSAEAVQWSAQGAFLREWPDGAHGPGDAFLYLCRAADKLYEVLPAGVNDSFGYEATLKMYDLAIDMTRRGYSARQWLKKLWRTK